MEEKKIKSFVKKNPTLSFILKFFKKNKNKNYEHFISDFSLFYHFSYVDLKKLKYLNKIINFIEYFLLYFEDKN